MPTPDTTAPDSGPPSRPKRPFLLVNGLARLGALLAILAVVGLGYLLQRR